jgi:hypothetical protein
MSNWPFFIAHVENPTGDARGMEWFQRLELFTDAQEFDRRPGDEAHGKGGTAATVAIDTGQDDA